MWSLIMSLIAAASAAGINFSTIFAWISSHWPNFSKALADLKAGANLQTILADLLAQIVQFGKTHKRAAQCTPDECCAAFCIGAAGSIVSIHQGKREECSQHLLDAINALCDMDDPAQGAKP